MSDATMRQRVYDVLVGVAILAIMAGSAAAVGTYIETRDMRKDIGHITREVNDHEQRLRVLERR